MFKVKNCFLFSKIMHNSAELKIIQQAPNSLTSNERKKKTGDMIKYGHQLKQTLKKVTSKMTLETILKGALMLEIYNLILPSALVKISII